MEGLLAYTGRNSSPSRWRQWDGLIGGGSGLALPKEKVTTDVIRIIGPVNTEIIDQQQLAAQLLSKRMNRRRRGGFRALVERVGEAGVRDCGRKRR
jgi:hypothetical protein